MRTVYLLTATSLVKGPISLPKYLKDARNSCPSVWSWGAGHNPVKAEPTQEEAPGTLKVAIL